MPPEMLEKNELVIDGGLRSLEICSAPACRSPTDRLLGPLQAEQSREFVLRTESFLRWRSSARLPLGTRVVRKEGKLGCLRPGAFADLLVIDGNPLKDISVLQARRSPLLAIMKAAASIGTNALTPRNRIG